MRFKANQWTVISPYKSKMHLTLPHQLPALIDTPWHLMAALTDATTEVWSEDNWTERKYIISIIRRCIWHGNTNYQHLVTLDGTWWQHWRTWRLKYNHRITGRKYIITIIRRCIWHCDTNYRHLLTLDGTWWQHWLTRQLMALMISGDDCDDHSN